MDGQVALARPQPPVGLGYGRGYLVLDGTATASVDCLWLPADEEVMSAACDAIAGHLERVGR